MFKFKTDDVFFKHIILY